MAKSNDKIYMPMGVGGLTRYSEEGKVSIKLKPMHLVGLVAGLVVIEILLKVIIPL